MYEALNLHAFDHIECFIVIIFEAVLQSGIPVLSITG
jgi:hypothetical protein